MLNKKQSGNGASVNSILGRASLWKGEIHAGVESLRIEGSVEGTIFSEGEVTIAPTGTVKGTIHAKHLIVTGYIEGNFFVSECLEIHGTGCVEGETEVGSLVVDEGGTLQGACVRRGYTKPQSAQHMQNSQANN
ncbi:MAG: polymer-forming cytoskeletal protein [Holophagaceae bacterium]|nr:polymer-forming cytoskeletal protein [Holophagaceae bacterium]